MSNLGELIDNYKIVYDEYTAANRAAKGLKDDADEVAKEIESRMRAENIDHAAGESAAVNLKSKDVPVLDDYSKLEAFVYKHKALHLLNRAINNRAWQDYLMERGGVDIPGVSSFERKTLSKPLKPKAKGASR